MGLVHNSGRRKGAFCMFNEMHHPDIMDFIELRNPIGEEKLRTRDLFLSVMISDLFMKRVKANEIWSLFDPKDTNYILNETYGAEYEQAYLKLEEEKKYKLQIPARTIWEKLLTSQIESGMPFVVFRDAVNEKSNQKNIGMVKTLNLCQEIAEVSTFDSPASCNLASISLSRFVENGEFNYEKLRDVSRFITRALNHVVDKTKYPMDKLKNNNLTHRPIGFGVQGLADVMMKLKIPFVCEKATEINEKIAETMYLGFIEESHQMALENGPYKTFKGSPISEGKFQFDLWGYTPKYYKEEWDLLRPKVIEHGVYNSLGICYPPTVSTSVILGNTECFESITSNVFSRNTSAGSFIVINKYLVDDLKQLGMWNMDTYNQIISNDGSVYNLNISEDMKAIYKTAYELAPIDIIKLSAVRSPFIDQSTSLNLYYSSGDTGALSQGLFKAWKLGLKTGMYYLRTKIAVQPRKTLSNVEVEKYRTQPIDTYKKKVICTEDVCISCSS